MRSFASRIFPGITFSGGIVPGGLIERMKAMIFHKVVSSLDGVTHHRHARVHGAILNSG